jgi:hypothetical protein
VAVGLIPAPDLPEKVAKELAPELPRLLGRRIDTRLSWEVSVFVDPLTGTEREDPEILDVCRERLEREGWDLAICLTDLPVYRSDYLVMADVSAARGVALVSVPALGATRLRPRVREATLLLLEELYTRIPKLGPDDPPVNGGEEGSKTAGSTGLARPFRRVEPPDEDMKETGVEARFAAPGALGHPRLLSGMVLANRPWKMLPAFKGAIAAAFATGAYALVITTLWLLADSVGWARLLLLMVTALVAMVGWIIVAHHLWERPAQREQPEWASLYNGVTVLTISTAVLSAYAILFALIFVAAWVFVPGAYFQSILKHSVGLGEYLSLAWLATSLATVAGAIGASLEHEETVRAASYGYRQRRRQEGQDNPEEESRGDLAKQ